MTNGLSAINSSASYTPVQFKSRASKPALDLNKSKVNNDTKKEEKKLTKTKMATYAAAAAAVIATGAALYKTGKLKGATNALSDAFDSVISGFKKLRNNISLDGSVSSLEKRSQAAADSAVDAAQRRGEAVQGAISNSEKKQNDLINNSKPTTKPISSTTEKIQTEVTSAAPKISAAAGTASKSVTDKLLFPNGIENLDFMQSNIGDCYLLSSVYGLSRNAKGQELLKNMVSIADDGNFVVKFNNEKPIIISPSQLKGTINKNGKSLRGVDGDLGLKAIECAYGKKQMVLALKNTPQTAYLSAIREGSPDEALKVLGGFKTRLYGDSLRGVLSNQEVDVERILNDAADNFEDRIICATTPTSRFAKVKSGDKAWMDKHKVFDCSHAYNISNIDKKHKKVTIINPHDTTKKEVLSFSEFSKIFSRVFETVV